MWARIDEQGQCVEFVHDEPTGRFHPSIQWVEMPEALIPFAGEVPLTATPEGLQAASLDELKARLRSRLAEQRWQAQVRGVRVGDHVFHSDAEGRASVAEALRLAELQEAAQAGSFSVTWKTQGKVDDSQDKFTTLGLADLQAVALAIGAHVTACFGQEAAALAVLQAAETQEQALQAYADAMAADWLANVAGEAPPDG